MVAANTQVINVDPDMSREAFIASLASTPAANDAGLAFDAITLLRVSPAFARAIFRHESQDGKLGVCAGYDTKSPGNTRSSRTGVGTLISVPGKGQYVKYPAWVEGWRDLAYRLTDSQYVYAQRGLVTIDQIIPVWAPSSDGNAPDSYINAVVRDMNTWVEREPETEPPVARPFHLALSYGHINTSGGDALEKEQTPLIGAAVRDACRARGIEVRVVQEEKGNGLSLDGVARTVVEWDRAGWPVDLYLEVHTEGGGAGGVFGIFPDWDGDYDGDAERIARDASVRISAAVDGLGVRGGGAMSERHTGVGAQGARLGIFRVTAPIKDHATRMIIEYGAHDIRSDYDAVMSHIPQCAEATAAAFAAEAERLKFPVDGASQPPPAPPESSEPRFFPETGYSITLGFRAFWESYDDALVLFGFPLTEEFTDEASGLTMQWFERARFERHPGTSAERYDVVLGRLGAEILAARP